MSFFEKLWFQQNTNRVAIERARELIQKTGLSLPCKVTAVSGQMVTVSFEIETNVWSLPQITIPKAESPWNFTPTQVGDYGYTATADVYLGGISGQGGGTADFSKRGNLGSTLVWCPVGNKSFSPVNSNAGWSNGPEGWRVGTTDNSYYLFADTSGTGASNGASGTFTNSSGNTLTIVNGIVTKIT